VFYSDNYISILPGENKVVTIDYSPANGAAPLLDLEGWNTGQRQYNIAGNH